MLTSSDPSSLSAASSSSSSLASLASPPSLYSLVVAGAPEELARVPVLLPFQTRLLAMVFKLHVLTASLATSPPPSAPTAAIEAAAAASTTEAALVAAMDVFANLTSTTTVATSTTTASTNTLTVPLLLLPSEEEPVVGLFDADAIDGLSRTVAIVAVGLLFALLTSVGNLMVMVSFKIDKQLQTISNYFLFSLAVADIAIGMISIPLMTYYIVNGHWGIGYTVCQFWLCIDYLMSNASVLNLLLISFDRYFSITRPLTYRPRRTTKKALTMIACTYIISLILWPPWIISWPYIEGKFTTDPGKCVVQFLETNPYVTVGTAIAAFYLPVTIMIILYSRVYWETEKRRKEFSKLQGIQKHSARRLHANHTSSAAAAAAASSAAPSHCEMASAPSSNSLSNNNNNCTTTGATATRNTSTATRPRKWSQSRKFSGGRRRFSWLRACTARSVNSSEDSSEVPAGIDDASVTSSFYQKRRGVLSSSSRAHSPPPTLDDALSADTPPAEGRGGGSTRSRAKLAAANSTTSANNNCIVKTTLLDERNCASAAAGSELYTVLIELSDDGRRPTVRLSSQESWNNNTTAAADSPTSAVRNPRLRSKSEAINATGVDKLNPDSSHTGGGGGLGPGAMAFVGGIGGLIRNGRAKLGSAMNGGGGNSAAAVERKSEKERKRNERKQDSKAAKTLSAILFAFIVTWTPYNVIVCWEAFFPNTFSETLFTISYCLCYINSTINPLCYALCNARFRHTYKRILRCRFKAERPNMHQQALLRRQC